MTIVIYLKSLIPQILRKLHLYALSSKPLKCDESCGCQKRSQRLTTFGQQFFGLKMYSPTVAILIFMLGSLLPSLTTANICVKQGIADRTMLTNAMTFRDLMTQSTMFVDKTTLIKDFLELPTKVVLVTCPRRWGKSLNMDMIREFLQITPEEIAQQTVPGAMSGTMRLLSSYKLMEPPKSSRGNYREAQLAEAEVNKYEFGENGRVFWDNFRQRLTRQGINFDVISERKLGLSNWSVQDSFNLGVNSFFDQNSKRKTSKQAEYTSFNSKPAEFDFNKPDARVEGGWSGLFTLTPRAESKSPLNKLTSKLSASISRKLLSNRLANSPANRMLRIKSGPSSRQNFPRSLQLLQLTDEEPAIGDDLTRLFKRKPETKNRNKAGSQKRPDVSAYRMFSHGETNTGKYTRLAIADCHEVISQYLGQHPVLHVSLLIPFGYSFDRILESLQQKLAQVYTHYAYVFKERAEDERDNSWRDAQAQDSWSDYAHVQDSWHDETHTQDSWQGAQAQNDPFDRGREMLRRLRAQNATEAELADSLRLLSQLLHQRYGARVFVLIDDYDTPVNLAFARYAGNSREHERLIAFMSRLFAKTFANNPHVEKSLVTGVNAIAVQELFAEVDYEHHNMLRSQVSRHYGFSETDVTQLFHEAKIAIPLAAAAKRFYAGYAPGSRRKFCNPWDISQFIKLPKLRRWWVETGGAGFFDRVFRFRVLNAPLLTLISRSSYLLPLQPALTATEYATLQDMLAERTPFDDRGVQLFFSFIFGAGYLTLDNDANRLGVHEEETSEVRVRLPNEEIASELTNVLLRYYDSLLCMSQPGEDVRRGIYAEFQRFFKEGTTTAFKEILERFLQIHPRFDDDSTIRSALNHVLLSVRATEGDFSLKTGRDGEDRNPRRPALAVANLELGVGVILELECGLTGGEVLSQAERYSRYFRERRVKRIRFVGVGVFPNKTVSIKDTWKART